MSRMIPLGSSRYAGNSNVVLPRQFEGELVAGIAVSMSDSTASQPIVKRFDGSKFAGFSVHDICQQSKTLSVIKKGESVCLRVKDGASLSIGDSFAADNHTGEIVSYGTEDSTPIMGDVAEINIVGVDQLSHDVPNCILANLYGGITPTGASISEGFPDAPSDGIPYVRQDGAWVNETLGVEDAPGDGAAYVRQDGDWIAETKGLDDAPSDDDAYVRKNATWVVETTGVEEAPNDGSGYVRNSKDWVAETAGSEQQTTALKSTTRTTAKK